MTGRPESEPRPGPLRARGGMYNSSHYDGFFAIRWVIYQQGQMVLFDFIFEGWPTYLLPYFRQKSPAENPNVLGVSGCS
jgi:hypothetical protein